MLPKANLDPQVIRGHHKRTDSNTLMTDDWSAEAISFEMLLQNFHHCVIISSQQEFHNRHFFLLPVAYWRYRRTVPQLPAMERAILLPLIDLIQPILEEALSYLIVQLPHEQLNTHLHLRWGLWCMAADFPRFGHSLLNTNDYSRLSFLLFEKHSDAECTKWLKDRTKSVTRSLFVATEYMTMLSDMRPNYSKIQKTYTWDEMIRAREWLAITEKHWSTDASWQSKFDNILLQRHHHVQRVLLLFFMLYLLFLVSSIGLLILLANPN